MAMFPCPRINEVLPPVASAVVISTTVAPTVGHGTSSLRAAARPYSPIRRQVATGRMIATGGFFHIQPSSYRPASTPLARAWMVPVGTINLFVGLTRVSDPGETRPSLGHDPFVPGQLLTATLRLTGEVHTEAEQALEDDADSAAAASIAESIATASVAGSIVAASLGDSITPVSNLSDFEDDSVLPLFSSDSDSDSVDEARYQYPTAVFMAAGEGDQPPQDPFSTPLPPTATAAEIEAHRAALEEQRKRELVERQKFRLEQDSVRAVSHYCNERNRACMGRIQAQGFPSARLKFDNPDGEVRVARPTNPDIPESSRAATPPPPPGGRPPPQAEVDANGLRLHSSPADNVAAAQAALANLPEKGEGAIFVQHAKVLVAKALEQQHAAADSQGRLYSRSSASRAASSAAANRAVVNVNNCPPPAPRAAHSTNHRVEPRPVRAMVAANGQAIDARTHILNDQQWRARSWANDRLADETPRQSAFTRVGPTCFGPMIRGEPYPVGFKGPRDIEKYDTHIDPTVWIDSYTMAMGILGYSELLAARYLPLMMDGVNRHWFNTLTPNSIDSWDEARAAFIQHFASAYTRATTIEDLDRSRSSVESAGTTSPSPSSSTSPCVTPTKTPQSTTVRRNRRPTHSDNRRGDYRFSGRSSGGKRRADGGHTELVANADYEQRDPKSFRRDNRAPREDRPQPKRFDARSLLDAPCIYHSREGKPSNHTTGNCYSLKQIERARRAKEAHGGNQHKDRAKDQDQSKEDGFGRSAGSLHTFTGVGDRRDRKVLTRAVAVHAVSVDVPRWLNWSEQSITWSREDHAPRIEYPGRVALVVRPKVADYWLPKTLMDRGSSINIMYYETFQRLGLPDSRLEDTKVTFHGIVPGRKAFPIGKVTLPVTFGTPVNYRTERITFEVVNFRSPYHCVLGRQAFARFMAAPHYAYNMMKMPGPRGIITVHGDPAMALECEDNSGKLDDAVIAEELDNNAELAKYPVDSNDPTILEKPTELDSPAATFKPTTDTRQVDLVENDSSVPRELAEHKLHVDPTARPVRQAMRPVGEERRRAIAEEVNRLLAAGFIIEIKHPKWLANPVLVLKKNKTWRMCIDYTSLNRACPKDPFVLPRIDQIIDAVAGSESLCFLDAYSGYNQIKMAKEDQEKTAFITPLGA
ncbi:hypothetical protein QYE76_069896 [Lolium multiflorum]|uniref:Uncharacterized protein n=1 Tax=Lolium multiflorum TaxID=4521 RepID=A0AAD8SIM8_LOLMU|nr:hypothetical protein QYE76_069896 [Lolium multiflorum]